MGCQDVEDCGINGVAFRGATLGADGSLKRRQRAKNEGEGAVRHQIFQAGALLAGHLTAAVGVATARRRQHSLLRHLLIEKVSFDRLGFGMIAQPLGQVTGCCQFLLGQRRRAELE